MAALLIDNGADVNAVDRYGRTPLGSARTGAVAGFLVSKASAGDVKNAIMSAANGEVVRVLARSGAEVSEKGALFRAVNEGRADAAKAMIDLGADKNETDGSRTLLHVAAQMGFKDAAQVLLDAGIPVEASDGHGATPLHYAVINDRIDVAQLLLQRGAGANAPLPEGVQIASVVSYQTLGQPQGTGLSLKSAGGAKPLKLARSPGMQELLKKHGGTE
jgi:ankyrin repeat protein